MSDITIITKEDLLDLSKSIAQEVINNLNLRLDEATKQQEEEIFLSAKETASFLKIQLQTVYQMAHNRVLTSRRIGKKMLFSKLELVNYLNETKRKSIMEIENGK